MIIIQSIYYLVSLNDSKQSTKDLKKNNTKPTKPSRTTTGFCLYKCLGNATLPQHISDF